jgi:hypothetical protein
VIYTATYVGNGVLKKNEQYKIALGEMQGDILVKVAPDYRKMTRHPSVSDLIKNWRKIEPL